jgi:protein phosphatase
MPLRVLSATDLGLKRARNEDSYGVWSPDDPAVRARRGTLIVVADGMGGSAAGEVASQLTVETVLELYPKGTGEVLDDLRAAIEAANREVNTKSRVAPELSGMGTTCTAIVIREPDAWIAHVGDSRAYLLRAGRLHQLTEDHSLVAQLVQRRQMTEEQARVDPRRNVITRSVGVAETVEVDAFKLDQPLEPADTLLLCSDGLYGQMTSEELAGAMALADLGEASQRLITLANEHGGPDNITGVLARLEPDAAASGAAARARMVPLVLLGLLLLSIAVGVAYWFGRHSLEESRQISGGDVIQGTAACP